MRTPAPPHPSLDKRQAHLIVSRLIREVSYNNYLAHSLLENTLALESAERRYWTARNILALAEFDAKRVDNETI